VVTHKLRRKRSYLPEKLENNKTPTNLKRI
jgi:hypothetical protein